MVSKWVPLSRGQILFSRLKYVTLYYCIIVIYYYIMVILLLHNGSRFVTSEQKYNILLSLPEFIELYFFQPKPLPLHSADINIE